MKQGDLFDESEQKVARAGGPTNGNPPSSMLATGDGESTPLGRYAELAYLQYAISVVKGRALPDVSDGQKPVQRRILYSMSEMGLAANAKPVKSARVVGDVLGKYHPHGEIAAYDALVRVAQEFSMRYPLIDGHGNFGSPDGDSAAAMRYTECRLTAIASLLLAELNQGTVEFVPNYDGAFKEPALLPARLPLVLLNGASGIAVGLSTEIPAHNLREVAAACAALVEDAKLTPAALVKFMPGPDFPGGGQIISPPVEIRQVYEAGRGSLKVRARWRIDELARGQWQAVVYELPPGTSAKKVLEEIEELTNPKVRLGKKSLTQEQIQQKQLLLSALDTVRDESGKDASVRLVFEPKSKHQNADQFMNLLLSHTSLEGNVALNLVMVGRDGRPRQKSLLEILHEWVDFRLVTMTRRTQFRLDQVRARVHILEGRSLVLLNIDKVIKIIRRADEPKAELMQAFTLTQQQADDILEIRLRQLARLEAIKIEQERKALQAEQGALAKLLAKPAAMRAQLVKEIREDSAKFGDDRRTLIEASDKACFALAVVDEPVSVILSLKGWIRSRNAHGIEPSSVTFKEGDALLSMQECRSVDAIVLLASNGRVYTLAASALPSGRSDGTPLTSLIELPLGARIVGMICGQRSHRVLLATARGFGLVCRVDDLVARLKAGKQFVILDEDDQLIAPMTFADRPDLTVAALSEQGRMLVFSLSELKHLPSGGRGVIVMALDRGEKLVGAAVVGDEFVFISGIARAGKHVQIRLGHTQLKDISASARAEGNSCRAK